MASIINQATLKTLASMHGPVVSRPQLLDAYKNGVIKSSRELQAIFETCKMDRGQYRVAMGEGVEAAAAVQQSQPKPDASKPFPRFRPAPVAGAAVAEVNLQPAAQVSIGAQMIESNLVPTKDPAFTPFGCYLSVYKVIRSGLFYPVFLTGLSGTGKTHLVEQACAKLGRELIRVQITPETDEDDLIGGFRLVNGETVWFDGPVTIAAQRGAVLLVDEIDYGTGKISCLQGILEGKGIFLKKVNRLVHPKPGFNIIATANTKGRGAEEHGGRYVNTQIINEAFLERFGTTEEQGFPEARTEKQILDKIMDSLNIKHDTLSQHLVNWAQVIRETFASGGMDDVISTRRLVHIVRHVAIFGDPAEAVRKCVARFDAETKAAFIELFSKVAGEDASKQVQGASVQTDAPEA